MKVFSIFMMMLMILSGFDLCAEAELCGGTDAQEISASSEKEKKPQSDMCTPFCHCARCAFSVILPENIKAITLNIFSADKFSPNSIIISLPVNTSIWQPPKFA